MEHPLPVKPPTCRLCGVPATETISVRPGQRNAWSLADPLCRDHADQIAAVMRIPVRRVAL